MWKVYGFHLQFEASWGQFETSWGQSLELFLQFALDVLVHVSLKIVQSDTM